MSVRAGSTMARASSGSRSRINSVELLMSANNAVTVLRSPSGTAEAADDESIGESAGRSIGPRALDGFNNETPQSPQKRLDSGLSAPHFEQRILPLSERLFAQLLEQRLSIF